MNRRNLLKTAIILPAALRPAQILPQTGVYRPDFEPRNVEVTASTANHTLDGKSLPLSTAEENAASRATLLDSTRRATLRRLANEIVPGASEAGAPEFLEFLAASSPPDAQKRFASGLHQLQLSALRQYNRNFSELDERGISRLLTSLRQPWSYQPADPAAAFLRQIKSDLWRFTRTGDGPRTYWYEVS